MRDVVVGLGVVESDMVVGLAVVESVSIFWRCHVFKTSRVVCSLTCNLSHLNPFFSISAPSPSGRASHNARCTRSIAVSPFAFTCRISALCSNSKVASLKRPLAETL
jgi:hypothetical protein